MPAAGFEGQGGGHEPRHVRNAALDAGRTEQTLPLQPLEAALGHLDVHLMKMISNFSTPNCKRINLCCFKSLSLGHFVTAAVGS